MARQLKNILKISTDKIDPENGRYGVDGHSELYGYGRINAFKAVLNSVLFSFFKEYPDSEDEFPLARRFVEEVIARRTAGKEILQFFEEKKFAILKLLAADQDFRIKTTEILSHMASNMRRFDNGETVELDEPFLELAGKLIRKILSY